MKHLKYRLSCIRQLWLWVFGKSTHNNITDECCPDFSCCNSELKEPFKNRIRYALKVPFWHISYNIKIWKDNREYEKNKKMKYTDFYKNRFNKVI